MMYYVYILGSDSRYYIGITQDIENRVNEHKRGQNTSTRSYKNIYLVGYFEKESKSEALKLERMIKKNGHIQHWINHHTFTKAT